MIKNKKIKNKKCKYYFKNKIMILKNLPLKILNSKKQNCNFHSLEES